MAPAEYMLKSVEGRVMESADGGGEEKWGCVGKGRGIG